MSAIRSGRRGNIHCQTGSSANARPSTAAKGSASAVVTSRTAFMRQSVSCNDRYVKILIRVVITAIALWAATLLPGIALTTASAPRKVLTLVIVAIIFGLINAFLKPIVKTLGCIFYVLTLGLFALVV